MDHDELAERVASWLWFVMPHDLYTDELFPLATWSEVTGEVRDEYIELGRALIDFVRNTDEGWP